MIRKKHTSISNFFSLLSKQYLNSWLVTTVVVSIAYLIFNKVVYCCPIDFYGFLKCILLAYLIVIFDSTLLVSLGFHSQPHSVTTENVEPGKSLKTWNESSLPIRFKNKTRHFRTADIVYLNSKAGVVTLMDKDSKIHITQFSSLKEVSEKINLQHFFRISRQYLINKEFIESYSGDVNRKLKVRLHELYFKKTGEISVSRYKNKAFQAWYSDNKD